MSPVMLGLFVSGLALLLVGAEVLVRGASRLAATIGISPLVIGLTVVAFGTGSPELVVSLQSSLSGQPDIALGNVVGSNIFNVLCILGLSALITPLLVSQQLVRLDVPLMVGISTLLFVLALDGRISRLDGVMLFGAVVVYTVWLIRENRNKGKASQPNTSNGSNGSNPRKHGLWYVLHVLIGLGLLVLGAQWLVNGAVAFAKALGVSELIIGLTLIAAGTSLPEVATSVVAAVRGERDIAVGNVVGSNIFNILAVLGLCGLMAPAGITVAPAALNFDIPVMIAVAFACLPIFFTGHLIARWEGALFFGYYIVYTLYLILDATAHDALPAFSAVMLEFALPLTVITLLVLIVRTARHRSE